MEQPEEHRGLAEWRPRVDINECGSCSVRLLGPPLPAGEGFEMPVKAKV